MQLAIGDHSISSVLNPAAMPFAGPGTLERAFDAHHAMVFRAAYRITGNAADAEDVLQTVFLRLAARDKSNESAQAARSESVVRGKSNETAAETVDNIEAYLRRAAVNASLNLLELRSRKNVPLDKAPEPHAKADQGDLREVLRQAMAKLGGRTAEMFALRFLEGHSNGEIAHMFGVSALVVGVTLHRARKQLQKEIRELGGLR